MLRLRGALVADGERPLTSADIERLLMPLLSRPTSATQFESTGDLDFAHAHGTKARFRANYLRKLTGDRRGVPRDPDEDPQALDELGVPPGIRKLAELRAGLVLVTGPTGSGKSTTLAAMIDHINRTRSGHILTIEDPVEFVHQPQQAAWSPTRRSASTCRRSSTRSAAQAARTPTSSWSASFAAPRR